jgi:hypothetical protein
VSTIGREIRLVSRKLGSMLGGVAIWDRPTQSVMTYFSVGADDVEFRDRKCNELLTLIDRPDEPLALPEPVNAFER